MPNEGQGDYNGLGGIDREALGIPSEEAIIKHYCQLRGIDAIEGNIANLRR